MKRWPARAHAALSINSSNVQILFLEKEWKKLSLENSSSNDDVARLEYIARYFQ